MKKKILWLIIISIIVIKLTARDKNIANDLNEGVIYLTRNKTGDVVEIGFEEYLKGVVYAEMPASFNIEALKAQAVAARTYTKFKLAESNHICDNPSHCQAWCENDYSENFQKVALAVEETKGETVNYMGETIQAFFHSSSGGKTESSKNVWGKDLPYLTSVDSPNEDKIMSTFFSEKEFTYKELKQIVNNYTGKNQITSEKLKDKIKILSRTEGNRVNEIKIDKVIFSGTEIRNMLELRSCNFDVEFNDKSVIFKVKGYGHGVGMSQWGAEVMAREGKNYEEILTYYYPNTEIIKFSPV